MIHWAIAIPFMTCYATALIMVIFYNAHPDRAFRSVVSWTHRISGLGMIVLPALAIFKGRSELGVHLDNIRQAWIWSWQDLKWLSRMALAAVKNDVSLPEQGKFNAAEKLNFMMIMTTTPLYIVTGVMIWMPGIAFFSWVLHFSMAVMATPLMLGHIYMATVNPDTRIGLEGMITGFVDRQWAKHHYRAWYRASFEPEPGRLDESEIIIPPMERPALVLCPSCREVHSFESWAKLLRLVLESEPLVCPHCDAAIGIVSVTAEPTMAEPILRHLERAGVDVPYDGHAEAPARSLSVLYAQGGMSGPAGSTESS
jgi:formate dehydrogenase subunit gamma